MMNSVAPLVKPKTSRMAIWSLILSCIPFVCPIGLILGISSAIKIGGRRNELSGEGWAVGGIVIGAINSYFSLVLLGIIAAIAIPNIIRYQSRAKDAQVEVIAHDIQTAVEKYKGEHNGERPKSFWDINDSLPEAARQLKNPYNKKQTYSMVGGGLVDGEPSWRGQIGYVVSSFPREPYVIVTKLWASDYRLSERLPAQSFLEKPRVDSAGISTILKRESDLSPKEIIDSVVAKYSTCQSYQDSGCVTDTMYPSTGEMITDTQFRTTRVQ